MSTRVLGVDIGSSAVRLAEVEVRGKGRPTGVLRAFGSADLPQGAVRAGSVVEPGAVGSAIKQAMNAAGTKCKTAIVGVGASAIAVREMALPQMQLAEARRSLPLYVESVIPMPADEAVLDFYPTSVETVDNRPMMNGMLVAVSTSMVSEILNATEKAGLDLNSIDLSAFAMYRALATAATETRTVAFVDLGARLTTVAVYSHGAPRLVRHVDGGTMTIADGVSASTGWSSGDSMNALYAAAHGTVAPEVAEVVKSQMDAMLDGIRQTIVYYANSANAEPVAEIVLTGGGALVPNLPQALASRARVQVSLGNVSTHVSTGPKLNSATFEASRPLLSTAIGLTLREMS